MRDGLAAEPKPDPIPLTVIGGYLGAGKTSLLNLLLHNTGGLRIAVLVNDFGRVNIDADLIARHDGDTISLTNGCICCSLATGFYTALSRLLERDARPEHVIVEASGVADPFKIAQYGHLPGFRLDAVIVLVDAETIRARARDKYVGATILRQLRGADFLVLTKVDLVGDETIAAVRSWLRVIAPGSRVFDSAFGVLPWPVIDGVTGLPRAEPNRKSRQESSPEHFLDYDTWSLEREQMVSKAAMLELVTELPESVLRGKGIVWLAEKPEQRHVFQLVGKRWSLKVAGEWGTQTPGTRLVFIGIPGTIDHARMERTLDGVSVDAGLVDLEEFAREETCDQVIPTA